MRSCCLWACCTVVLKNRFKVTFICLEFTAGLISAFLISVKMFQQLLDQLQAVVAHNLHFCVSCLVCLVTRVLRTLCVS